MLSWHFDMIMAPGGRDVEWLKPKSYAMMEKQPFHVQLRYAGGKDLWVLHSSNKSSAV